MYPLNRLTAPVSRAETQRTATRSYAQAFGWEMVADGAESAICGTVAPDPRPMLGRLVDLDAGKADNLFVSNLNRVGRNAADVPSLADRAQQGRWGIGFLDLRLNTTTPSGRQVLGILASVA